MIHARAMWLVGLVALALVAGCKSQQTTTSGKTEPVAVLSRFHGSDPGLKQAEVMLVTTQQQLDKSGSQELAKQLKVDFNRQSLVVLALGQKPTGGYWGKITGVQRRGTTLFVQGLANRPSVDQPKTEAISFPVDAVVIPRQDGVAYISREIESVTGKEMPAETVAPVSAPQPTAAPAAKMTPAAPATKPAK